MIVGVGGGVDVVRGVEVSARSVPERVGGGEHRAVGVGGESGAVVVRGGAGDVALGADLPLRASDSVVAERGGRGNAVGHGRLGHLAAHPVPVVSKVPDVRGSVRSVTSPGCAASP